MPSSNRKPVPLRVSHHATAATLGFDLTIKRSPRRRTLEIIIRRGEVLLMLPQFVAEREGLEFVRRKRPWVLSMLERQQENASEVIEKQYVEGEQFDFLGRAYRLRIAEGRRGQVELDGEVLRITIGPGRGSTASERVRKTLWQWYQDQARDILTRKTDALTARIQRPYAGVVMRRTKTKWGHCTRSGLIQYNWQIVLAPESVLDYLVAHEVSHLVHPNHSKRFWAHVERLYPNYKQQRRWLKDRGHTLLV